MCLAAWAISGVEKALHPSRLYNAFMACLKQLQCSHKASDRRISRCVSRKHIKRFMSAFSVRAPSEDADPQQRRELFMCAESHHQNNVKIFVTCNFDPIRFLDNIVKSAYCCANCIVVGLGYELCIEINL